jgi:Rad3-related DNA helicase
MNEKIGGQIMDYFPMANPRPAQVEALEFIQDAVNQGYRDIVIAAPTGVGKTGIGTAVSIWGSSFELNGYERGGYYLVTQKMLQDQLEADFPRFIAKFRTDAGSIKSSSEYGCQRYGNCMLGGMASAEGDKNGKMCSQRANKTCPYQLAKWRFSMSKVAVTNYPYLFTEHLYVNELPPRNIIICDECHTLERQITGFVEVVVDSEALDNWAPDCRPVPKMNKLAQFVDWLKNCYLKTCTNRLDMLAENLAASGYQNRKMQDELKRLQNHVGRITYAVDTMVSYPKDWIFWQKQTEDDLVSIAKPLSAAPFAPQLLDSMSAIRVYMSAYPGPKDVFCRSMGLDPAGVAWLELDSTFPVDNRLVHMTTVGSMGRKYIDETLPRLMSMCSTILDAHPDEKGIIHCHSYALGQKIYEHMRTTPHGKRLLFSQKAASRVSDFNHHRQSTLPTVMLSPSIVEGYSFDDDLARFQIIAKVPFPYLGDEQVAAKMEIDKDWYTLQTVMTILQACGRIVRSETDHGSTYILDRDFIRLYNENSKFFPKWFKDSFKFYS